MAEADARMQVSLGGRLVVGIGDGLTGDAGAELDPCPLTRRCGPADIDVLRSAHVTPPLAAERAGDGGDGWVSALEAERLYLLRKGRGACVVDGRPGELPLRVAADAALPTWALMRTVVRPLMQLALPARGAVTVHAAAVARPGAGLLIAGWSESGKTEVALALAERGWSVVADKWTVLDESGTLAPFPVRVGIRGWALDYLPRLRSSLAARQRWRMAAAARGSRAARTIAGRAGSPPAGAALDAIERAFGQGERLSLTLSDVRARYRAGAAQPAQAPLTAVVVLRTVAGGAPVARALPTDVALRRLRESAAYERRDHLGLLLRRRFARGEDALAHAAAREQEVLAAALADVPLVEVSCRFPSDPGLVADLLEGVL